MRILSLLCSGSLLLCMFGDCLLLPQPACAQPQAAADTNGAAANLLTRALELLEEGLYEEALEACEQAIKIAPDDAEAWLKKGNALADLGRHEEALEAYDQAIKIDPKSGKGWCTKGRALFFLKRYTLARDALYTALELGYSEAREILEIMRKAGLCRFGRR